MSKQPEATQGHARIGEEIVATNIQAAATQILGSVQTHLSESRWTGYSPSPQTVEGFFNDFYIAGLREATHYFKPALLALTTHPDGRFQKERDFIAALPPHRKVSLASPLDLWGGTSLRSQPDCWLAMRTEEVVQAEALATTIYLQQYLTQKITMALAAAKSTGSLSQLF